ncbi:MAG: YciI family protein [Gemmatimonadaceae bacterium]
MRYMLMMNVPAGGGDYQISSWTPDEVKAHMAFMHRLNKDLQDAGEWVDGQGLTPPNQARLVRAGKKGEPITDGPFPESKEFLAGFWIIDADSDERAYAIAARASTAPGPGGAPLNMAIEVRPVLGLPTE